MIPIIIICHGKLAEEFKKTSEMIMGRVDDVEAISFARNENCETLEGKIAAVMDKYKNAEGFLIFTDIFGGSCTNASMKYLERGNVEIISGVNISLLLETIGLRFSLDFSGLVARIRSICPNTIVIARDKLSEKSDIQDR